MSTKENKKRIDQDIRPYPSPAFHNYDYGGPEDGEDEDGEVVGPGRGLYNGSMDKYDSVKDFVEKSRRRAYRKKALHCVLISCFANII